MSRMMWAVFQTDWTTWHRLGLESVWYQADFQENIHESIRCSLIIHLFRAQTLTRSSQAASSAAGGYIRASSRFAHHQFSHGVTEKKCQRTDQGLNSEFKLAHIFEQCTIWVLSLSSPRSLINDALSCIPGLHGITHHVITQHHTNTW